MDYAEFLRVKSIIDPPTGIAAPGVLPHQMFEFQADIVRWALRRGRAALFAGTGLGKSFMELAWGQQVAIETNRPILHLAPLAVSAQMVREANKFGIPARIADPDDFQAGFINITNYQRVNHFNIDLCGGVILDESSILKNENGHYRNQLIERCANIPFRLAATATPAPNDFMELGNHAEFLGIMSYTDMLATFFTHDGGDTQKWRLKGHAENEFWKWMATWSVMLRKPSDIGYADNGYDLPPLNYHMHSVAKPFEPSAETGTLFPMIAHTMAERLAARRDTVEERVAKCFSVVIGSLLPTLEQWHGNLNTQSAGAQNTNLTQASENAANLKGEAERKMRNTCGTTMPQTNKNTKGRQSIKPKSIASVESVTHQILNLESNANNHPDNATQAQNGFPASNPAMELMPNNTNRCLIDKTESAPFAEISPSDVYTWITAMKAAQLEGCFAVPATPGLDISKMTRIGLLTPYCIWCNLNSEQDALAKALGPLAFSVKGSMSDEEKEAAILAWINGDRPVMISKPSIMGFGMNFQHCHRTGFIGLNDSWEQFYQAVRRFWRFGQAMPVDVDIIAAETEGATVANIRRKEADAERMANAMVRHMADLTSQNVRGMVRDKADYNPQQEIILPSFVKEFS